MDFFKRRREKARLRGEMNGNGSKATEKCFSPLLSFLPKLNF